MPGGTGPPHSYLPSLPDIRLTDLQSELERALTPHYRLSRELGGGGMSRVFLAEEVALGRDVVIKVLPPNLAVGVSTDRFRREMQLVARLQHPHIVPILSTGVAGELLYYVMPYIKGESLRARLSREGSMPVEEAARILREVADALSFAHSQGVVHRDIKPDNVLLTSGHALVTDFGVAKAIGVGADESGGLTSIGMALGTPTYMAPEQAAADPHVDHRADLYALGVLGYEMLAGQPPFVAPTVQALLAAHVTRQPESLRVNRPAVPEVFDAMVLRCLAKQASDRYQHAGDLLPLLDQLMHPSGGMTPVPTGTVVASGSPSVMSTALLFLGGAVVVLALALLLRQLLGLPDWVVAATLALLAIGFPIVLRAARGPGSPIGPGPLRQLNSVRGAVVAGGLAFLGLTLVTGAFMGLRALGVGPFATLLTAGTIRERDRILVAEFTNTTPDTLLGGALTEALTVDLSQSKVVRLMSPADVREALRRMRKEASTPLTPDIAAEIAAREGVKVIVAGEITPFASGYALSARVLDPKGTTLFATRATADGPSGILPALDQVSHKLREAIGESLRSIRETQSLEQVTTTSLEALQLYSRANRSKVLGLDEDRLPILKRAVALDPSFAMAWRAMAAEYINAVGDVAKALEATEQARRYRDRLPDREALQVEALYSQFDGNLERGIEAFRRILASWPDDMTAINGLGLYLRSMERYEDAEKVLLPVVESGKALSSQYYNLATTQLPMGKFEAAERTLRLMRERLPQSATQWQVAYYVAAAQNHFDSALVAADTLTRLGPSMRYWGNLYRLETLAVQGRLRSATEAGRSAVKAQLEQGNRASALWDAVAMLWIGFQLRGDSSAARADLDRLLATTPLDSLLPADRPYGDLIRFRAALSQRQEAGRLVAAVRREIPAPLQQGDLRLQRGLAELALVEGRPAEAIALARVAALGCGGCTADLVGQAFENLGQTDSAITAYERALRPPTYGSEFKHWRPAVMPKALFRVAELYEQKGQRTLARDRYASFVDLWQHADPELQPAVTEARRRLKSLVGEGS